MKLQAIPHLWDCSRAETTGSQESYGHYVCKWLQIQTHWHKQEGRQIQEHTHTYTFPPSTIMSLFRFFPIELLTFQPYQL